MKQYSILKFNKCISVKKIIIANILLYILITISTLINSYLFINEIFILPIIVFIELLYRFNVVEFNFKYLKYFIFRIIYFIILSGIVINIMVSILRSYI